MRSEGVGVHCPDIQDLTKGCRPVMVGYPKFHQAIGLLPLLLICVQCQFRIPVVTQLSGLFLMSPKA